MRLLSLLQLVEDSVAERAPQLVAAPTRRQANYAAGRARMVCADGSSLLLQGFPLADGQLCIKATGCNAAGEAVIGQEIYASAPGFEWRDAADSLAEAWVSALAAQPAPGGAEAKRDEEPMADDASDELAATA
ncbi:MAG TPA: hypothetical protein VGD81_16975 [Opitutaceae bacterium]